MKKCPVDGIAMKGHTRAPRKKQGGGYLAPKGSMSVREAGETMHELSKRKRGFAGGGAASSYNRRYNNQNK